MVVIVYNKQAGDYYYSTGPQAALDQGSGRCLAIAEKKTQLVKRVYGTCLLTVALVNQLS